MVKITNHSLREADGEIPVEYEVRELFEEAGNVPASYVTGTRRGFDLTFGYDGNPVAVRCVEPKRVARTPLCLEMQNRIDRYLLDQE